MDICAVLNVRTRALCSVACLFDTEGLQAKGFLLVPAEERNSGSLQMLSISGAPTLAIPLLGLTHN